MSPQALFGTCVAFSFVAWGIIAAQYLRPALRSQPRARRPLRLFHSFRFIGLARVYQVSLGQSLRSATFPRVFLMICAARVYRLMGQ